VSERPIHDPHPAEPIALEREQRKLDHLTCTEQQSGLVAHVLEDLTGEIDCDTGHRNRPLRDAGFVLDSLRGGESPLEQPRQYGATHFVFHREPIRIFHLPENLRLTDHHRIERRRHAKHMPDRVAAAMLVTDVLERLAGDV